MANRQIFTVETPLEQAVRAAFEATENVSKPLSQEKYDRVTQVQQWYLSEPHSFERLTRAVALLDIAVNEDESAFVNELLDAYQQDEVNPESLAERLREYSAVTGSSQFDVLADQLTNL